MIKIGRPGGETARHYDATVHGISAYFVWLNRGKESAVLDLRAPQDRDLFLMMLGRPDVLVRAESGIAGVTCTPDERCKIGVSAADISTELTTYAAVLEALIARGITGRGHQVDVAMFDALADWMTVPLLHHEQAGYAKQRHGLAHAVIYNYGPMACTDRTLMVLI